MKMRTIIAAMPIAFTVALSGCTNTQPAYYGNYPAAHAFGPNHGYEPYASAPHDPIGAYYQNFAPATPYYYEPPESHRDCDARPCIAYPRNAEVDSLQPEIIALPSKRQPFNPPSTISRTSHSASTKNRHAHHEDRD